MHVETGIYNVVIEHKVIHTCKKKPTQDRIYIFKIVSVKFITCLLCGGKKHQ